MSNTNKFELKVKIESPAFQSGKEKHRYIKTIIEAIDKQFNAHTFDLGDWPLAIRVSEKDVAGYLSFDFRKALEPNENSVETMNKIIAYMKSDLKVRIVYHSGIADILTIE